MILLAGYIKHVEKKICWKIAFLETKNFPARLICKYTAVLTFPWFFFPYILPCKKLLHLVRCFFSGWTDNGYSGRHWGSLSAWISYARKDFSAELEGSYFYDIKKGKDASWFVLQALLSICTCILTLFMT